MNRFILRLIAAALFLSPVMASADPVKLKLAFFSSDRSALYLAGIKPFVTAVNAAAKDLIHIEVNFSSTLGPVVAEPQMLLDGTVDIAFMTPRSTAEVSCDDTVVELPGLFRDA